MRHGDYALVLPRDLKLTFLYAYRRGYSDAANSPEVRAGRIAVDQARLNQRISEFEKVAIGPEPEEESNETLLARVLDPRHPQRQNAAATLIERVGIDEFTRLVKVGGVS